MTGRVAITLLVRDEIDVVDTWLAYHLRRGVDVVLVTDHRSVDGTTDVLRAWAARDARVRVWREDGDAYEQSGWVTRMARAAAVDHQAAWVLHADADEFWWPAHGDLRSTLAAVPADVDVLSVPRANFLPSPDVAVPFFARMVVRERVATNFLGHPLPPKVCHRACPDVVVETGNHAIASPRLGAPVPAHDLEILHYPVRTWPQLERKIVAGAAALAANPALPEAVGITWRRMRSAHDAGGLRAWWDELVALGDAAPPSHCVRDDRLARWLAA